MEFRNSREAIEYLKSLDSIIMPPQFTYFNHCTVYQSKDLQKTNNFRQSMTWTELPLDEVVLHKEMSFKDRDMRITQALEKGSLEDAEISYNSGIENSKKFMLRVIMPKSNLSLKDRAELEIDDEYQTKLVHEWRGELHGGLDRKSHASLNTGEKLLTFACSTTDEISGKKIDVFYTVREQDAIMYAKKVASELEKQSKYSGAVYPTSRTYDQHYDFDKTTYSISKSKDFSRYTDRKIIGDNENGPVYGTEFTRDYIYEVQQEMIEKRKKEKQKLESNLGFQITDYYTVIDGDRLVNVPKTRDMLIDEFMRLDHQIEHRYYSKLFNSSDEYIQYMRQILMQVYDDMKKNAENNIKTSPLKPDSTVNTPPPQAIPIKERVLHPGESKEVSETRREEMADDTGIKKFTFHLDRLAEQKQELIKQKEELISKSVTRTSSEPQYDEYGVEISKINEEMQRRQQTEQTHDVGRRR